MLLAVPIPPRELGCDGYIDNRVTVVLDRNENIKQAQHDDPIAVEVMFCTIDDRDVIPRDEAVSQWKLSGEGTPSEIKVVLGWMINTWLLRVFLPMEKIHNWLHSLLLIVEYGWTEANP